MRKLLAIIVLGLLLVGCAPTTSELYTKVKTDNKVIGMPASNKIVAKILKKLFRKNDWKIVIVDTGTVKTTGSATDKVNLESEYKSKTSYIVSLWQRYQGDCGIKNEKVTFALTIIDSKTGEEAFVAEGDDCIKTISKDLEVQLSPFWN
jgi:PBP1b-binding outer membrane lipoprotein LpoB